MTISNRRRAPVRRLFPILFRGVFSMETTVKTERARPAKKGRCSCCASVRADLPLYRCPSITGLKLYCADCCHSLGFPRAGETTDGIIIRAKAEGE